VFNFIILFLLVQEQWTIPRTSIRTVISTSSKKCSKLMQTSGRRGEGWKTGLTGWLKLETSGTYSMFPLYNLLEKISYTTPQ